MEIWLDTCDSSVIEAANRFGFIYGVTTNPSILAEADDDHEKIINTLLEIQDGPVAVQVTAEEAENIVARATALHAFSERIIVKIPVTQEGLAAMKILSKKRIPIMATAIYQPTQALLAALAGANYIAPYIGRMLDAGIDAYAALHTMLSIYQQHGFKTKILGAALKTPEQIITCAEMGLQAVTLKSSLFSQLVADDPYTLDSLKAFIEDWESRDYQSSSALVL